MKNRVCLRYFVYDRRLKTEGNRNVKNLSTGTIRFISVDFRRKKKTSNIDRIKTFTSKRCDTHTLYHSVKGIIPKIINNI